MVSAMAADRFFWVSSCALAGAAKAQAHAATAATATRLYSADMSDLPGRETAILPVGRPATLRCSGPANPRLPKKKAWPAERTSYALNSSGDYPRMASRARVCHGGGFSPGWLALPRADLQLAGGKRIPGGDHSPRRAGADSPGFHLVSGSDAIAAARDFSDGDVGGALRCLPRNPDAEAPAVFHRRRRRDRKGTWYRRLAAGVLPWRAAGLLHRAD